MRFKGAVDAIPSLKGKCANGLQALEQSHSARIGTRTPRYVRGSVALDRELMSRYPTENRWDYGIGFTVSDMDDRVIWIEVHTANSLHVKPVLEKLRWLRNWLSDEGKPLSVLEATFVWLSTGRVAIPPKSPEATQLRQERPVLVGQTLDLDTLP